MRKVDETGSERIRLRQRDTFAVALTGAIVLIVLAFSSALGVWEALAGAAAIFALAAIYHLIAATTLTVGTHGQVTATDSGIADVGTMSQAMVERLPFPVLLIGPDGKIEQANPAARGFLGLGAEGGQLSGALRQPKVLEAVSTALRGEVPEPVEYSTLAPIESHVRAHVTPLKVGTSGHFPWRALLVMADETSIKRAERMRADFLANASHELRTPLASLAGFIETLRGHARDDVEARTKFLAIMQDQTERMRRLIDDLLSLSRVEMDEHLAPSGEADLAALAGDVADAMAPLAREKGVRIVVDAPESVQVIGDRDQLVEVAQNLLENALKYSRAGTSVRLEVQADQTREQAEKAPEAIGVNAGRLALASPQAGVARRYGVLRVRDAGSGIERRYLPRLSERFYRIDGQKSGPREGTGLGLAIVKHIVNRHRGGFVVESAPGEGSVFSVYIPAVAAVDVPDVESNTAGSTPRH